MPTYNDAVADALEAAEAIRAFAHASRNLESPEAAYRVLGAASAMLWSLQQSLDQIASWHESNSNRAFVTDEPAPAGKHTAHQAANDLRFAALSVARAGAHVDKAWNRNGRITWTPDPNRRASAATAATPAQTSASAAGDGVGR